MGIFNKKKRGLIVINVIGAGMLNRGIEYTGPSEVVIVEETERKYKVRFIENLFQRSEVIPKWYDKNQVEVLL